MSNGQGSASAPDLLVSRGAVDDNDMPDEFNIFDRNIIEDLNKLHNDNTVHLNETFYSIGYTMTVQKKLHHLSFTLEGNLGEREEDQHNDDFVE